MKMRVSKYRHGSVFDEIREFEQTRLIAQAEFPIYLSNCFCCSSVNQAISNPCSNVVGICSPCYNCLFVQPRTFSCTLDCDYNLRQACVLLENTGDVWRTACKCQDGYLPVASSCVDRTIIIANIHRDYRCCYHRPRRCNHYMLHSINQW